MLINLKVALLDTLILTQMMEDTGLVKTILLISVSLMEQKNVKLSQNALSVTNLGKDIKLKKSVNIVKWKF